MIGRPKASTIGQYDGDGRWMCCVGVRLLLGDDLLGRGDLAQLVPVVLVLFVLAVEELVERVTVGIGVEVVLLRRAGGHPLELRASHGSSRRRPAPCAVPCCRRC